MNTSLRSELIACINLLIGELWDFVYSSDRSYCEKIQNELFKWFFRFCYGHPMTPLSDSRNQEIYVFDWITGLYLPYKQHHKRKSYFFYLHFVHFCSPLHISTLLSYFCSLSTLFGYFLFTSTLLSYFCSLLHFWVIFVHFYTFCSLSTLFGYFLFTSTLLSYFCSLLHFLVIFVHFYTFFTFLPSLRVFLLSSLRIFFTLFTFFNTF